MIMIPLAMITQLQMLIIQRLRYPLEVDISVDHYLYRALDYAET